MSVSLSVCMSFVGFVHWHLSYGILTNKHLMNVLVIAPSPLLTSVKIGGMAVILFRCLKLSFRTSDILFVE